MKYFPRTLGLIALTLSLSNSKVFAVTSISQQCPDKFIGTVKEITDSQAPFSSPSFEKLKISLQVKQVFRGEEYLNKDIQILKHGPHVFEPGKEYVVELNNGFLCSARPNHT